MTEAAATTQEPDVETGVETFTTTADNTPGARKIETVFDFGGTLDESVSKFGAEVIHGNFIKAAKINLQAYIRRLMAAEKPLTDDEIKAKVAEWKPGVRAPKQAGDAIEALAAKFAKLPEDKKKAMLEKLMASLS